MAMNAPDDDEPNEVVYSPVYPVYEPTANLSPAQY